MQAGRPTPRWWRLAIYLLAVIAIIFASIIYWLFYDNRLPRDGSFTLDIDAIRRAAAAKPGAGPMRIESETVSHTFVPMIGVVAGTSWRWFEMIRVSYRLVYRDRSILIDTGFSPRFARQFGVARYDPGAWRRIQHALDEASAIVVTHEHADHIGGLMDSPHLATILPHALLTPEQIAPTAPTEPLRWPPAIQTAYRPFHYAGIAPIAPGVVLVKAPGHTPGSQMIYVRRADGRELLFLGDVASAIANVNVQHIRPLYTTNYYGNAHDDRRAVMLETMALHRLHETHPEITLVPGHDAIAIDAVVRSGLIDRGFRFRTND